MDYRNSEHKLLMELIASLTLADHMGDVSNDVSYVLTKLGLNNVAADDWDGEAHFEETMKMLHGLGVTTLYGTSLELEPKDEGDDD